MAELAKLRLVMEIDGDNVVVNGIERVDAAVERGAASTTGATGRMAAGMGEVATASGRMAAGMSGATAASGRMADSHSRHVQSMTGGWSKFERTLMDVQMRFMNLAMAAAVIGTAIVLPVQKGVEAVDAFKVSTLQVASQLTQMQGPENIAENYRKSVGYAGALAGKLEEIDAESLANNKGLEAMLQTMTMQGVVMDINNKKQVESFTAISNAIASFTQGQDQSIQAYQEMRSLMSGQVDMHSQVSRMIDQSIKQEGIYKGGLKEVVELGKQHGDLLERLAPYLRGISAATADLGQTWSTAKSSMETAVAVVLRAGFAGTYKDIVRWLQQANTYLKEHAAEIGGRVQEGWRIFRGGIEAVLVVARPLPAILSAIVDNIDLLVLGFSAFAGVKLVSGLTLLIGHFNSLKAAVVAVQAAVAAANLASITGGLGAAVSSLGMAGTAGVLGAAGLVGYTAGKSLRDYLGWDPDEVAEAENKRLEASTRRMQAEIDKREQQQMLEQMRQQQAAQEMQKEIDKKIELEKKLANERKALADAQLRNNLELAKQSGQLELEQLQSTYSKGLVSTEAYYQRKAQIARAAIDQELSYLDRRTAAVSAQLAGEKDPEQQLKLKKDLLDLERQRTGFILSGTIAESRADAERQEALERDRKGVETILDATAKLNLEYLQMMGVRKEYVDLIGFEYDARRKVAELEHEIARSQGDPAKLTALQAQLSMENLLTEAKREQLQIVYQASLQNEQFALQQKQIDLLGKQGRTEEAFDLQRTLDLRKAEFDYRQKMLEYQRELNEVTRQGLTQEAELVRQNMQLYAEMYNQAMAEINSRTYSAASSGSSGETSTTNWSGLNGTYVIQTPVANSSWMAEAQKAQQAAEQAAEKARQAWESAQAAATSMAEDLSVRVLKIQGLDDQASLQKLLIDQQHELTKAQQDGIDTTQLLIVQQMEYAKAAKDVQIKLLKEAADAANKILDDTRSQLDAAVSSYASQISNTLDSVTDAIKNLQSAAVSLRGTASALLGGGDSILSPQAKYDKARQDFLSAFDKGVNNGDLESLQSLGRLAETYLSASRDYNASGGAYAADFAAVQSDLLTAANMSEALAASLTPQKDVLTLQLEVLSAIKDAIKVDSINELQKLFGQLGVNNAALSILNSTTGGITTTLTGTNSIATALGTSGTLAGRLALLDTTTGKIVPAVGALNTTTGGITTTLTGTNSIATALGTSGTLAGRLALLDTTTGKIVPAVGALNTTTGGITTTLTGANSIATALGASGTLAGRLALLDATTGQIIPVVGAVNTTLTGSNSIATSVNNLDIAGIISQVAGVTNSLSGTNSISTAVDLLDNTTKGVSTAAASTAAALKTDGLYALFNTYATALNAATLAQNTATTAAQVSAITTNTGNTVVNTGAGGTLGLVKNSTASIDSKTGKLKSATSSSTIYAYGTNQYGQQTVIPVNTTAEATTYSYYARGGLAKPGWAIVGEEGPELVNFSQPGRVYTADQTRAALSGDNGETVAELRQQNQLLQAQIRVLQAGFTALIDGQAEGNQSLKNVEAETTLEKRKAA